MFFQQRHLLCACAFQGSFRSDDRRSANEVKKCWINFRIRSVQNAQINKKQIAQDSPFFGNSGIQWSNFEDFLGRFSGDGRKLLDLIHKRRNETILFPLCLLQHGRQTFQLSLQLLFTKAFYSYVLWLVKVSIELLLFQHKWKSKRCTMKKENQLFADRICLAGTGLRHN